MDIVERMRTYVRIVDAGSLAAAAKQLRLSSAAVSRQLLTLETALRVRLLQRTTRRMSLTEEGQRYYQSCLRVLREVEDAQAVGRAREAAGRLTVSVPVSYGSVRVVPHLGALLAAHPQLRLDLRLEDANVHLLLEGVDVAVRVGAPPPDSADIIAHRVGVFRRALFAAPGYLRQHGVPKTPHDLPAHRTLLFSGARPQWTLTSEKQQLRLRVEPLFRSNSLHAVRDLAVEGHGVTMLPLWFVQPELRKGKLRRVLTAWQSEEIPVLALHRAELRGAPRVTALVQHLRRVEGLT